MKKIFVFSSLAFLALALSYCSASKKAAKVPKSTYAVNLIPVMEANCTPCHFPGKGGNKKPYDNYANIKTDIDEIIRRISLEPTEKGFMPFKKAKLDNQTIAIFQKWKEDGLLEN